MKAALAPLGVLFWGLVIVGAVTEDSALIGLAVVLGAVVAVFAISGAIRGARAAEARREAIWQHGRPVRATVVSLEDTTARLNGHPRVVLTLEPVGEGGRLTVSTLISQLAIPRVQPGCEIDVRVDDAGGVAVDPGLRP